MLICSNVDHNHAHRASWLAHHILIHEPRGDWHLASFAWQIVMQAHEATSRSSQHARTVVRVQEVGRVVAGGGVPTIAAVPQLLSLLNGLRKSLLVLLQTGETTPNLWGRLQGPICC